MTSDSEAEHSRLRLRMVWASSKLSGVEKRVLDVLDIESMPLGVGSNTCEIRPRTIAERIGAGVRAVNKALKSLRERGFIEHDRYHGVIELRHDVPCARWESIEAWLRRMQSKSRVSEARVGTAVPNNGRNVPDSGTGVPRAGAVNPVQQHEMPAEDTLAREFESEQVAAAQLKYLIPLLADVLANRTALRFRSVLEELLGMTAPPSKLARAMASLIAEILAGGIPLTRCSRQIVGRSPREQVAHAVEYPHYYRDFEPNRLLQIIQETTQAEYGVGSAGPLDFLRHTYTNAMQIKVALYAESLLETVKPMGSNID